jgi:iron-sulfur cluster assembly protein
VTVSAIGGTPRRTEPGGRDGSGLVPRRAGTYGIGLPTKKRGLEMLMLTRDAAEVIKGLSEAPGAEGVRISAAAQSVDGQMPGLQIALAPAPQVEDAVVEAEGAHIFLAPEAAQALDGKVLDADVEGEEVRFAVMEQTPEEPDG